MKSTEATAGIERRGRGLARCDYCVSYEQELPIVVASNPTSPIDLARLWPSVKHYE